MEKRGVTMHTVIDIVREFDENGDIVRWQIRAVREDSDGMREERFRSAEPPGVRVAPVVTIDFESVHAAHPPAREITTPKRRKKHAQDKDG